ncbi:MAG: DUF4136 domain-containing protein [Deltaproteobacteria bacterium]|nr:DUF4136 domain-containing protein [Deltaproteobacteria bacterium]
MRTVRNRTGALAVIALGATIVGCATAVVKQKSSPAFDASAYQRYQWATPVPIVIADEERERDAAVLEWTVRHAVDQQLAAKGYQQIAAGNPDFLVDFGIRLEEKSTDTFGEYIAYRDAGGRQELGPAYVFGYEESAVLLEVTDARSGARLWHGSARTVLDDGQDVTRIESAVTKLMAEFPSRAGSPAATAAPARKASAHRLGDIHVPEP